MDASWSGEHGLRAYRPVIMGSRGAVACGHPLAAQAGAEALRHGASAADAAVVVASVLAVVEPMMSGVGGDGFFLHYNSQDGRAQVINATGPAPEEATAEAFAAGLPTYGAASASVPGLVDGWYELNQRFGSWDFGDLLQAAIYYAGEGFGATRRLVEFIEQSPALADDPETARVFLPAGRAPRLGEKIVQRDLARTLGIIATGGSEAFYRGPLGARFVAATRAKGGLISKYDLVDFTSELQEPISTTYRGYTVLEAPPNSTGFTLLQELNLAEQFDLRAMGPLSADLIHTLVEIKKLAFLDREAWGGDPRFVDAPLERLLSKAYARELAARVDPRAAAHLPVRAAVGAASDTTYFCVVDGRGNAVSGIQSINGAFGAATIAGDTGILLNNRMQYWHLETGHPNRLEPGKRVRHTMNPPLVLRDGQLRLVFGTPGADAQVQTNLQVLTHLIDFDLDPQQAVEAPRWRSHQPGGEANWPHTISDRLVVEDRLAPAVRDELARRGHQLELVGPLDGGCNAQVILRQPDGMLLAAADPRRDGYALAY
jgi:gamma-glutamyltranspeptidase/glutathione hydrolase